MTRPELLGKCYEASAHIAGTRPSLALLHGLPSELRAQPGKEHFTGIWCGWLALVRRGPASLGSSWEGPQHEPGQLLLLESPYLSHEKGPSKTLITASECSQLEHPWGSLCDQILHSFCSHLIQRSSSTADVQSLLQHHT